ncbi:MAG: GNAT family N-acetyltransferase, partial [Bacteroidota bacterium]
MGIKEKTDEYEKYGFGRWRTLLKDGLQFVAWVDLSYLTKFDLGYGFLAEYWGRGIATEASRRILNFGFDKLALSRIIAIGLEETCESTPQSFF